MKEFLHFRLHFLRNLYTNNKVNSTGIHFRANKNKEYLFYSSALERSITPKRKKIGEKSSNGHIFVLRENLNENKFHSHGHKVCIYMCLSAYKSIKKENVHIPK